MSILVITGTALLRARGLPLTLKNALASHACTAIENNPSALIVEIPRELNHLQTGEEFVQYLGLI